MTLTFDLLTSKPQNFDVAQETWAPNLNLLWLVAFVNFQLLSDKPRDVNETKTRQRLLIFKSETIPRPKTSKFF